MRANGVDALKHGRAQPFYHVLADTRDRPGAPVTYVAHENILPDTPPEALRHPLLDDFFSGFDAARGRFVPNAALRGQYPADETAAAADAAEATEEEEAEEDPEEEPVAESDVSEDVADGGDVAPD